MAVTAPQSLSQAASLQKKPSPLPYIMLMLGMLIAVAMGGWSFYQSQLTEKIVILARDIPYGQQLTAEDLAVIEVQRYRPAQLTGIADPNSVIGRWAARDLGTDDLVQPAMLLDAPPAEPVYPNGRKLTKNMVPVPFAVSAIGPITDRDLVNIGFSSTNPELCLSVQGASASVMPGAAQQSFACRFLSSVRVLYLNGDVAYLEVTPYQAHALWSLQSAGVQLWGERYGATSDPLQPMDRLDASAISIEQLAAPAPVETNNNAPASAQVQSAPDDTTQTPAQPEPVVPGSNTAIPGSEQP